VAAERILERHAEELAAVVFDPVSYWIGLIPPAPEFLVMLREFTRRHGIVLVFDEVVAFRIGYHGAQGVYGVQPDLTGFAKIIGGGFPVGAIGGSADVMSVFEGNFFGGEGARARLSMGGTFNGNATTMVAGLTAMELMTPDAFDRLNGLGTYARRALRDAFKSAGYPGQVTGVGSFFRLHLTERPITGYRAQYWTPDERVWIARLQAHLLNRGIFTQPQISCLSTAMTEADLDFVAEVVEEGLRALIADGCMPRE
jgi:glutamate-1-semialdehyde 2,1-aminomutase